MKKRTRLVNRHIARDVAARAGLDAGRVPLAEHPQGRKLLGAVARAERMREHLDGILFLASRGVGDPTELARLRAISREVDAMWLALVKKRSLGREVAMRFLDAADYASRLDASMAVKVEQAAEVLAARLPDVRVKSDVFADAITAWSKTRRDWSSVYWVVRRGVTQEIPRSPGALRVQYSRWRESLAASGRPRTLA